GTEAELRGVLGPYAAALAAQPAPQGAEGFRLRAEASPAPAVLVVGNDARGVLFGVGKLLRTLRMEKGSVLLPGEVRVSTAPRYPIRGHQLGNRTLNNSVDAWTVPMWEQYFRDLAVFGANTVELLPPQANGNVDSPHSPLPLLEMMAEGSRLLNDYGLDVWIWFPALAKDYSDPATVEAELKNWTRVYQKLPRIDAVFVPGGDPGHTQPKYLMPFLEKQAQALRKFHPKAQMWVSPQGWDEQWLGEFYQALAAGPEWLNGVVHGPGVRVSLASLRASVPKRYRIRTYPDVTHTVRCSYPVPDWDPAWAMTLGREPINPRPVAQKKIFQGTGQGSAGFVTYSDGSNDDVNKMVWSSLGWDPEAPLAEILQDYGRYFIGNRYSNDFAQGLFALEQNWSGPLLAKTDIEITLQQFRSLEHSGAPGLLGNWRFQQALYRAYYDAYVRGRLLSETTLQAQAMEALEAAPRSGSLAAIGAAEKLLEESSVRPPFQSLRARVFELGAALYQSIGMQLSTELYGGYGKGRAATLDTVDAPLNDRIWLKSRFAAVRAMPKEEARLDEISTIVNWRNPGPGGFYDDLGNPGQQPHFVQNPGEDPPWIQPREDGPLSWASYAMSGRRAPVHMRYTGLDPEARYRVRVVYSGGLVSQEQGIRLLANGSIVVHPYLKKPQPVRPVEFDVPLEATRGGELTLDWDREATPSGRSRGAEVAEVWLMKK
ncbi:MAG: hypothetical protein NTY38_00410, partial [Acidobacteria bacterium]|nr:hypothetical protein [Acidobacteriota bacterium]